MSKHLKNLVFRDLSHSIDDKRLLSIHDVDGFDASINSMEMFGSSFTDYADKSGLQENFAKPGFKDVTSILLEMGDELEGFLKLLPDLTQLKSIIFEEDVEPHLSKYFEAAPQLENIKFYENLEMPPTQYTQLRQLISEASDMTGILQAHSLPNLEVLEVAAPSEQFVDVFNKAGLTNLKHFGFDEPTVAEYIEVLKALKMPDSVISLLLCGETDEDHIEELARMSFSKRLTHLTLRDSILDDTTCLTAHKFPSLQFLKWSPWSENELPEFFFDDSLDHLKAIDLCGIGMQNNLGKRLLNSPLMQSLDTLYLGFNCITDPHLVKAFHELPCTVSLIGQQAASDE